MKADRLYSGYDSYGRAIEAARSISGKWFAREYKYNGYNKAWSKWAEIESPGYITVVENKYSGELIPVESESIIEWGWNRLRLQPGKYYCRLPG